MFFFALSALVFSHSLVEHAVVDVLMSYITDTWKNVHLNVAAVAVNTYEVTSTIAVVLLAHASDAYFGHFKMILITTKTYILVSVTLGCFFFQLFIYSPSQFTSWIR